MRRSRSLAGNRDREHAAIPRTDIDCGLCRTASKPSGSDSAGPHTAGEKRHLRIQPARGYAFGFSKTSRRGSLFLRQVHSGPIVSPLTTIHQGKHFIVQHFRASGHVRLIRTDAPLESISDATSGLDECGEALAGIDPKQYGVLFDWRRAPLSTDPDLHKALVERIDAIAKRFQRGVFLVRAGVGAMQVNRIGRTLGSGGLTIFNDEAHALEFLTRHR